MMDFTLSKYRELLLKFQEKGYAFFTFEEYCQHKGEMVPRKQVILRHDVDLKAENSLEIARIENSLAIRSSYYFRVVEQSNKPEIIREIVGLGHEIGYHYEDMAICNGDAERAMEHFTKWLEFFRQYYPVKTICMHGSPRSKYDGKDLWKTYNYRDLGIIGEPYFDTEFSEFFYITDTGRRWDGFSVSVRDRIPEYQDEWIGKGWVYHSTDDILEAVGNEVFPERLMMTTHPQRWTGNVVDWASEMLMQTGKNVIKKVIIGSR